VASLPCLGLGVGLSKRMDENLMQAICEATARVVADVEPVHYQLPTPCAEWTVHNLANHLLGTLELGRALLSDEMPTVQAGPGRIAGPFHAGHRGRVVCWKLLVHSASPLMRQSRGMPLACPGIC